MIREAILYTMTLWTSIALPANNSVNKLVQYYTYQAQHGHSPKRLTKLSTIYIQVIASIIEDYLVERFSLEDQSDKHRAYVVNPYALSSKVIVYDRLWQQQYSFSAPDIHAIALSPQEDSIVIMHQKFRITTSHPQTNLFPWAVTCFAFKDGITHTFWPSVQLETNNPWERPTNPGVPWEIEEFPILPQDQVEYMMIGNGNNLPYGTCYVKLRYPDPDTDIIVALSKPNFLQTWGKILKQKRQALKETNQRAQQIPSKKQAPIEYFWSLFKRK